MLNPQAKAIRCIEWLLLLASLILFVIGNLLGDTFFLRLATLFICLSPQRNYSIIFISNWYCHFVLCLTWMDC